MNPKSEIIIQHEARKMRQRARVVVPYNEFILRRNVRRMMKDTDGAA